MGAWGGGLYQNDDILDFILYLKKMLNKEYNLNNENINSIISDLIDNKPNKILKNLLSTGLLDKIKSMKHEITDIDLFYSKIKPIVILHLATLYDIDCNINDKMILHYIVYVNTRDFDDQDRDVKNNIFNYIIKNIKNNDKIINKIISSQNNNHTQFSDMIYKNSNIIIDFINKLKCTIENRELIDVLVLNDDIKKNKKNNIKL